MVGDPVIIYQIAGIKVSNVLLTSRPLESSFDSLRDPPLEGRCIGGEDAYDLCLGVSLPLLNCSASPSFLAKAAFKLAI